MNITKVLQIPHPDKGRRRRKKAMVIVDFGKAYDSVDKGKHFKILDAIYKSDEDLYHVALIKRVHSKNE